MSLNKGLFPDSYIFMLAESLYQLGRFDEAARSFTLLENSPDYRDIALYRTGQPQPNGTVSPVDIYQLRKIAGSSADSQWRRFATQKLRYVKMVEML
jgi:hypothetical protein